MKAFYTLLAFIGFYMLMLAFLLFTGYLYYFADCKEVKNYWLIVETPARCLQ